MVDLAKHAEILELIAQVDAIADELTPNEREMFGHLKTKYDVPGQGAFDDQVCLEVLLRNVGIRKGYDMTPAEASTRVIDLPRR